MKASDAFPSKYISAADLQGRDVVVKITHVTSEKIGDDQKFICYFAGGKKGLALNRTNWNAIARISGQEDSDDWTGVQVCLFEAYVDYKGESVPAVRVKPAPKQPTTNGNYELKETGQFSTGGPRNERSPQPPMQPRGDDPSDDIPF